MADTLRLALVGCGGMMGAHVKNGFALLWERGYREFEIVACCDAVESSAARMATGIGEWQGTTPVVYTEVETLLADEADLHAVDISVTHCMHHRVALPCLEAKKHVMVEKPLAMTMRAAKGMREAAEANGVLLNVAENYRRSPANRAANWVIKSGRLGRLRQFYWIDCQERRWHWGWRDELDQAGGGWTFDGGVHFADLMRYHVGPVSRATALTRQYNATRSLDREDPQKGTLEATIEDTAMALLEFENGATGVWVESIVSPGQGMGSHIVYGEEGSLDFGAGLKLRGQEQPTPIGQLTDEFTAQLSGDEKERLFPFGLQDTISQEVHEFVEACLRGGSLETDAVEGYKAQAVCMAVYESAALGGQPVELSRIENLEIETYQSRLNAKIGVQRRATVQRGSLPAQAPLPSASTSATERAGCPAVRCSTGKHHTMHQLRWLDTHIHVSDVGNDGKRRPHLLKDLLAVLDGAGADLRFVLSPDANWNQVVMQDEDGVLRAAAFIHDLVRRAPGRLYGSCLVNPHFLDASLRTLELCFGKWGFVQLGEMLQYMMDYQMDTDAVERLVRAAVGYGVPVQVHVSTSNYKLDGVSTGTAQLRDLIGLAQRVPEAKYILAHLIGQPDDSPPVVDEYLDLLDDHYGEWPRNFWAEIRDFSSPGLRSALDRVPADRLLCGTDWTTRVGPPFLPYGMIFSVPSVEENPYPPSVAAMVQLAREAGATDKGIQALGFG
ncbi:MAG: hypothetical protein COZ06_13265, partial [Armatimonadetes bacterium CG_4_10_14_3_um_filter_66_18]